jgi:formate-dependent nitrite reductase membrane component NrfD
MITLDEITVWLLFIAAVLFLVSMAVLVYCCALLLNVRHKIKQFAWRPEVIRDGNGRRRQERV